ncbi:MULTISPECIES: hypothetical protein [unclassified Microbacterium]|nr:MULTISPECIES: hypothetical protein [unclassified Microbacterium]
MRSKKHVAVGGYSAALAAALVLALGLGFWWCLPRLLSSFLAS